MPTTVPDDTRDLKRAVYEVLTGEDDGRVCRDIPESACNDQPRNFVIHIASLAATKTGDGLADPKLVISWLLSALGAPGYLIGFLVPVREAGALLPQLVTAATIRELPQRKWAWAVGSLVQGLAIAGIAGAALTLDGAAAGWAIVGLLAVFAVARSVCSVSYKDVLGKTVSKSTRGTATGTAGTVSAALVFIFGAALALGVLERSVGVVVAALLVAAGLWLFAAGLFTTLSEEPGAVEGGGNPLATARRQLGLFREDPQLTRFVATRGLLTATALAPPYLVALAGRGEDAQAGQLGAFIVASSAAAFLSNYVWGRLSDISSRRVLAGTGAIGALALAAAAAFTWFADSFEGRSWAFPAFLFVVMIAYQGVRLGRSTHIVDMADSDNRAAYTALSNTAVGLLLIAGGAFGALAELAGQGAVLAVFAAMCAAAALVALGLREVQATD